MNSEANIRVEKRYFAMGGEFTFMCFPQSFYTRRKVENLFDQAFKEIIRIEEKFTDFKPSYFNQINKYAGVKACCVDDETFDLVKKSLDIASKSKGLFDITYASIGHLWRIKKRIGVTLSKKERKYLHQFVNYKKIRIDEKNKSIYLPHSNMKIGLGGIGKGYAVDCAYSLLRDAGLYNFYINGSGDIGVHSTTQAPRLWKIGIRNPFSRDSSKSAGILQIANGAIATSGSSIHKINQSSVDKSRCEHHIINPLTGDCVNSIIASTVLTGSCINADTTATILMNMSVKEGIDYLNQWEIFGVLIDMAGKTYLSELAIKNFGLSKSN